MQVLFFPLEFRQILDECFWVVVFEIKPEVHRALQTIDTFLFLNVGFPLGNQTTSMALFEFLVGGVFLGL